MSSAARSARWGAARCRGRRCRSASSSGGVAARAAFKGALIGNMGWLDCRTVQNLAAPASVGQRVANSGPARKGTVT